jgi:hypothetical protein
MQYLKYIFGGKDLWDVLVEVIIVTVAVLDVNGLYYWLFYFSAAATEVQDWTF